MPNLDAVSVLIGIVLGMFVIPIVTANLRGMARKNGA